MSLPALALLVVLHLAGPARAGTGAEAAPGPAPVPILGPDGPLRLGPLTSPADPRGVVQVDPRSGRLYLELPGVAGRFTWDGHAWWLDGARIGGPDRQADAAPDPVAPAGDRPPLGVAAARWVWGDGSLRAIVDAHGGRIRVTADDRGAPARIQWPDGNEIRVQRDGFGRVVAVLGPGAGEQRFTWQDGGLRVTDAVGRPLTIRSREGSRRAASILEVQDAAGRTTRTFLDDDGGLLGWGDPRGLETWLRRTGPLLEVVDGVGRTWRVRFSRAGRVEAVDVPGGGRWTWRLGNLDQLVHIEDPAGRVHDWTEDRPGRLEMVGEGRAGWRLRRDPAGRVVAVVDPAGAITELRRDGAGRVVGVVDALGNPTRIDRDRAGDVVAVEGPDGARWKLSRDLHGRPSRVEDPTGNRVELRRDGNGRLAAIVDARRGRFELARGLDGRLSRIKAPTGETLALERDALGRVSVVRMASGRAVTIRRDIAGDPVEVRVRGPGSASADDVAVAITRDAGGRPVAAGAIRWRRDGAGRVVGIEAPGHALSLVHDPAGAVRRVEAGEWWVELHRDGAGRVIGWTGSDGEVRVRRDPVGRIVEEEVILTRPPAVEPTPDPLAGGPGGAPAGEVPPGEGQAGDTGEGGGEAGAAPSSGGFPAPMESPVGTPSPALGEGASRRTTLAVGRDLAGRPGRLGLDEAVWRLMRGADGRPLRLEGPDGLSAGMDRDAAGRMTLLRLPSGALARRTWLDTGDAVTLRGMDGRELDTRLFRWDALDRLAEVDDGPFGGQRWRWDPDGRLVLVEDRGGEAWSWTPGGMRGPGGVELTWDERGRVATARPPVGPAAWWVGAAVLSYAWTDGGPLSWVAGERGAVAIRLDGLGRLVTASEENGRVHRLRYDARGRLSEVWRDAHREHRLVWGLATPGDRSPLLASGPDATDHWVWSDWGPAAVAVAGRIFELLLDPTGRPWWSLDDSGVALRHGPRLRGYPELARATPSLDLVGPQGTVQVGPGGPLIVPRPAEGGAVPAGLALDPVSGQRVDGLRPWPWQVPPLFEGVGVDPLDPSPWQSTSPYGDPLSLLVAMGELEPPVEGAFLPVAPRPPELPALPGGLSTTDPPLGPPLSALPIDVDPLAAAVLRAALDGGPPLDADFVLRVQLGEELGLPWLPPGLPVPLPESWRAHR